MPLPAAICRAIAHRHRHFPRDRAPLERAIAAIGAGDRFRRAADGRLLFRPDAAERRAIHGAAANPRIAPLAAMLSETERAFATAGIPRHAPFPHGVHADVIRSDR